jgi:GNAT superfamily N-acetyltransferase
MHIDAQFILLATKSCSPIHRDSPTDYVSTIRIDILYGDERKEIGQATVYRVRMDQLLNDDAWALFDVFDCHSSDLGNLYEELFADDELIPELEDELMDYGNVVLIKSILLLPEYRGQGLGGLLALAIAERFDDRDIVALKPWPMTADDPENVAGAWDLPRLSPAEQKAIAGKLRNSYRKAGFKPFFRGSEHLFLTHLRHPSATQLIDKWVEEHGVPDTH